MPVGESFDVAGTVLTMAESGPGKVGTFSVRDGHIAERSGDSAETTYDFGDRVVLPGFIDPHTHAASSCIALAKVDCRAPSHASIADVLDELRDAVGERGEGEWIVAQANLFFDQKLSDHRYPSLAELDAVSTKSPIAIQAGGHVSVLNSRAMELAEIGRFTTGQDGASGQAVVELDRQGNPTGVVSEIDAFLPLPRLSDADLITRSKQGLRELYTQYGVTSIGEISDSVDSLTAMASVVGENRDIRIETFLWAPHTMSLEAACDWTKHIDVSAGRDWLAIKGVKLFCDGGYSAHNAATLTPYLPEFAIEEGSRGQLAMTQGTVAAALEMINNAGLQMVVHVNGERAQVELARGTVTVLEKVGSLAFPVRAEHAGNLLTDRATADRWAEAGLVPVSQPGFLYNFGDFLPRLLGEPAQHGRFPFRSLLEAGWELCGSSDYLHGAEERQSNPLFGVWCCVARRGFLGDPIELDQATTVDQALRMFTISAAKALGVTDRGSLEPGKVADFVVLKDDPRSVSIDSIPDVAVDYVFVDGRVVYSQPGAEPPRGSALSAA
jgi:predicted amidohydrolase YtcJ